MLWLQDMANVTSRFSATAPVSAALEGAGYKSNGFVNPEPQDVLNYQTKLERSALAAGHSQCHEPLQLVCPGQRNS